MFHSIFAACAVGFLKVPTKPFARLTNPLCSPTSASVENLLILNFGQLPANTSSNNLPI